MAFPAAPTESGGAKLHFLTTDGNAAAGWLAVDTGTTGTGANVVGFAAVATHVEGEAVGAPGGLATTSVPLVLGGADDGTNAVPLQADASAFLKVVLQTGSAAYGKLAANTGVDIGDVDVTSIVPGVAATNLGKAEDAAHASGDVGVQMLAVRKATAADLSGADGDYEPLQIDNGRLWTSTTIDAALPAGTNAIGKLAANSGVDIGDVTLTAGTSAIGKLAANTGVDIGDVDVLSLPALAAGSNAIGKLAANTGVDIGDVDVTSVVPGTAATNLGKAEDAGHSSGDVGVMAMSVRQNTAAALSGADADYQPLITDTNGRLHVLDANTGAIKTAVELIDNAVDGNYLNVNANIAGTDFVGGAGAVAAGVQRTTLASDDPAVALLGTMDADTGAIKTAVELLDDAIYVDDADWTDGSSKHLLAGGLYQSTPQTITDGDVGPLEVDSTGRLRVVAEVTASHAVTNAGTFAVQVDGNALTALQLIDNPVAVLGTATYTETTTSGQIVGVVRNDTLATLAGTDNEIAPLQVNASGALYTVLSAGSAVVGEVTIGAATGAAGDLAKAEDAVHASGDIGVMSLAVRNDALAALGGADGDYAPFQVDAAGALYTRPHSSNTGGCKMFTSVDLDESEEDPAAGPVTIYGIYAWNTTAAPKWLQMFNTNTVTVGTTAPTNNFMIPANADSDGAGVVLPIPVSGLAYSTALTVAATGASGTDATDPGAAACGVVIFYQD